MGFDPQNAGEPIVNVHKRTTKVNLSVVVAVILFIVLGAAAMVWVSGRSERGEPLVNETPAQK